MYQQLRKLALTGYLLIGLGIIGIFSIYLPYRPSIFVALIFAIFTVLGGFFTLIKYFMWEKAKEILPYDLLYIAVILIFSIMNWPYGLNYLLALIIGGAIVYIIDKKKLQMNK